MNSTNLIEDLRLLSPPSYGAWWAVVLLGLAAAGVFLLLRRRRSQPAAAAQGDGSPPLWETALAELERLTRLLRPEKSRDYGIASTQILRVYIENRYTLHAPKLATEEFLLTCGGSPAIPEAHRASLKRYLELCDLLKFGRYVAATSELVSLHEAAVNFVLASRPEPSPGAEQRLA